MIRFHTSVVCRSVQAGITGCVMMVMAVTMHLNAQEVGGELSPWNEGIFDIHHISTDRGDAAFMIMPDGTTMLIDAGQKSMGRTSPEGTKPDATRSAGEWIARYILHYLSWKEDPELDYVILSHFHGDHMGAVYDDVKTKKAHGYYLTGITEVAEYIPVRKLIDRGHPDYNYPEPLNNEMMRNYKKFLSYAMQERGMKVEKAEPGSKDQIVLQKDREHYPGFSIRVIAANGEVWTGIEEITRRHFPAAEDINPADPPVENGCSIVSRFSYGKFDYYTGGDLTSEPQYDKGEFHNMERPVAQAVGPVEVGKANHHGYAFETSGYFVQALRPRVWVMMTSDQAHCNRDVLRRIWYPGFYRGPREVFVTGIAEAARSILTLAGLYSKLSGTQGHIVIRVEPGGDTYRVYTIDDTAENYLITGKFGPYRSN